MTPRNEHEFILPDSRQQSLITYNHPMTHADTSDTPWSRQLWLRFRAHWWAKSLGTIAGITAFMWVYFWLLRHPQFPVTVMPLTPLDRLIPFTPWALLPYATLWLYISLAPALLATWREMAPYLAAVATLTLLGFALFWFWPTEIPVPAIDWNRYPSVEFLKSVDASGNACPSLHVAFAVLTALWLHLLLKLVAAPTWLRVLNGLWCLLIAWSTLAIKQHVALDMEAGALLGLAVGVLHLHLLPRLRGMPVSHEIP
ncbi:MAG TPA: phosphatase PAP2 family protein [Gammaproteobacteria bacterium]|nr:phosphatase PAP2 family protein [Gammaproteobacteria bacterium]